MEQPVGTWTARKLALLLGLPVPTVTSWVATGLITAQQYGRGRKGHSIGMIGLLELITVNELRSAGFSMQKIRRVVQMLHEFTGEEHPFARLTILAVDDDIIWKDSDDIATTPVSMIGNPAQRVMLFPVGERHSVLAELLRNTADQTK